MKDFKIHFDTRNAAFEGDDYWPEVARILRDITEQIQERGWIRNECPIYDVNGNLIGFVLHGRTQQEQSE